MGNSTSAHDAVSPAYPLQIRHRLRMVLMLRPLSRQCNLDRIIQRNYAVGREQCYCRIICLQVFSEEEHRTEKPI